MQKPVWTRNLVEETRHLFEGHPPPRYFDTPQTLPGDTFKNPAWKARRTEQTASGAACDVGLSSYPNPMNGADGKPILEANAKGELVAKKFSKSPQVMWHIRMGLLTDSFSGNEATRYGDAYEYYARCIGQVVFDLTIKEYGTFSSRIMPFQGSSPDGGTNAIRIIGGLEDGTPIDWTLGSLNFEIKTTMAADMKTFVDVSYVVQIYFQMWIRQQSASIVQVWSRNRWRSYLYTLSWDTLVWIMRRLLLAHEYFKRKIRITEDNPYLSNAPVGKFGVPRTKPYAPPGKAGQVTNAWYFRGARPADQWAPHLTVADWDRVLGELGITHEEFCAIPGYAQFAPKIDVVTELTAVRPPAEQPAPESEEDATKNADAIVHPQPRLGKRWCMDAGQHALPARPPLWAIHQKDRVPKDDELEKDVLHPVSWVQHHDSEDATFWNRDNFEHVTDFAKKARAAQARGFPYSSDKPWRHIDYLYIDEIVQTPELNMPEPIDSSGTFESEEEALEYADRFARESAAVAHLAAAQAATQEKIRAENELATAPLRVIDASNSIFLDLLEHKRKKPAQSDGSVKRVSAPRKRVIAKAPLANNATLDDDSTEEPVFPLPDPATN